MVIKDHPVAFTIGMAHNLPFVISRNSGTFTGDKLPESLNIEAFQSLIIGLAMSGALNIPYDMPEPPETSYDIGMFYKMWNIVYPELLQADLGEFYGVKLSFYPQSFMIDLANFYNITYEYPEVQP